MRRIFCIALAAVMLFSLAACGENQKKTDGTDDQTTAVTEPTPKTENPTEKSEKGNHDVLSLDFIRSFDQKPFIEEQVVYEEDGLSITAKSIRYDTVKGPQIVLAIRNDSQNEALIQNNNTVVNGYMMKPEIDVTVPPKKELETAMSLPYIGLAMADIHSLAEVEFSLNILDSKTYALIDTTDPVRLILNDTAQQPDEVDESGQLAYDNNGVKVVVQGVKRDVQFDSDAVLTVYMLNKTDKTVSVQNKKLTVNGYEITAAMQTVLLPGKRAVDKIELFDSELDEHGISSLDSIEVAFDINDYESWDVLASTDTLSVVIPTETAESAEPESAAAQSE